MSNGKEQFAKMEKAPELPKLPPVHQFWDAPAPAKLGESQNDAIHLQVGKATSAWEMAELKLSWVFATLVHHTPFVAESRSSYLATQRVYGNFVSVAAKIDAMNAAAEVAFHERQVKPEEQEVFKLLTAHYRNAAARRNEIVHATVVGYGESMGYSGLFLAPPFQNTKKNPLWSNGPGPAFRYTASDIAQFVERFGMLERWAGDFSSYFEQVYVAPKATEGNFQ